MYRESVCYERDYRGSDGRGALSGPVLGGRRSESLRANQLSLLLVRVDPFLQGRVFSLVIF